MSHSTSKNSKNSNPIPLSIRFAALAVDAVCFRVRDGRLEVLLGKVTSPNNVFRSKWAHIGGLIHIDETADDAVNRLLKDKGGIKNIYKEQLYTFSSIDRDPRGRVVAVAYLCLIPGDSNEGVAGKGRVETAWLPVNDLPKLAYDHDEITRVAVDRLRAKITYTDIARHLMSEEFTLSELQKVYEVVLGVGMDKRNFRKRILSLDVLFDTKRTVKKGVMRPASLYSFKTVR